MKYESGSSRFKLGEGPSRGAFGWTFVLSSTINGPLNIAIPSDLFAIFNFLDFKILNIRTWIPCLMSRISWGWCRVTWLHGGVLSQQFLSKFVFVWFEKASRKWGMWKEAFQLSQVTPSSPGYEKCCLGSHSEYNTITVLPAPLLTGLHIISSFTLKPSY